MTFLQPGMETYTCTCIQVVLHMINIKIIHVGIYFENGKLQISLECLCDLKICT